MKKKKNSQNTDLIVSNTELIETQQAYVEELNSNPEYSLEPDPTGELNFDIVKKDFVRHYVNFKNIGAAAELAGIDPDLAKQYFVSYDVQREIRRINRALYHRQFSSKLISIDEIGGYLSSLLTGENVPIADQLKTPEKLRIIELLFKLNEMKRDGMNNPGKLAHQDLESQIKKLSVKTIQHMLATNDKSNVVLHQKNEIIASFDDGTLSVEEKAYLSTLPVSDLLKLVEDINKGGQTNDSQ